MELPSRILRLSTPVPVRTANLILGRRRPDARVRAGGSVLHDRARRVLEAACVQIMSEADAEKHPQPFRADQGLAARRLPAYRGRRDGAQPQPGQLFRRSRTGRFFALKHRVGHRLLAGQKVADARFLLRGCSSPPPRYPLRSPACQRTALPNESLPQDLKDYPSTPFGGNAHSVLSGSESCRKSTTCRASSRPTMFSSSTAKTAPSSHNSRVAMW